MARWRGEAARVTITRDDWGIAHVHGKGDADAVFGAIYAQAEDDFGRIEANYLTALGRTAEAEGPGALWNDLRQRLYVDPVELQAQYRTSPAWLRGLMDAWADGLNFYLATHPTVHPKVLTRFEPWMALSFTEGSIGGDIERISTADLAAFYGDHIALNDEETGRRPREPRGSNGIAIAPKNTVDGHALLLINPHTSFYFRSELQMISDTGLNAYGASTWGQFFIYQGFNEQAGWMHTSSGVDNVDQFEETVTPAAGGKLTYRYGTEQRPVVERKVTIAFRQPDGGLGQRSFTTYRTHHGPVVAARGATWITQSLMWKPILALEQSWLRTRAHDLAAYMQVASRQANSSNDTLFADGKGEIAYLHPQFVPVRNDRFDYTRPVDGSDPATDWHGLHPIRTLPNAINPGVGWAKNSNDWPWQSAGPDSPRAKDYPRYMDQAGANARGTHSDLLLTGHHDFTPVRLIAAAYDSYLPAFAALIPKLVADYNALPAGDARRADAGRADRVAEGLGRSLGRRFRSDLAGGVLGRRAVARRRRVRPCRAHQRARLHRDPRHTGDAPRRARPRRGEAHHRFRRLARAMGEDQPLPATRRFDRRPFRRHATEHPRAVHLGAMGQPRLLWRACLCQYEELLRHERQQLCRGDRVRPARARLGGDRGRRERRPGLETLQRPGNTLCERRATPGLFLPRGTGGAYRAPLQAGRVNPAQATLASPPGSISAATCDASTGRLNR
ncbi:MAG: acylase [Sphingomonas bacterium]|nr:acylase [Sphingomonas bacterium]